MMGGRTDTNEMQEVIPGMEDYDDRDDDRYVPVENYKDFDPEAFRRMFISYMTAACVLAIVLAVMILSGAGVYALVKAII